MGSERPLERFVCAVMLSGAVTSTAGCTLLDEPFEPSLLAPGDAAVAEAPGAAAPPGAPSPPAPNEGEEDEAPCPGASNEGRDGVAVACLVGIEGPPDAAVAPADADAGAPPSVAEPRPPAALLLSPCAAGFGAFSTPERVAGLDFDGAMYGPALAADGRTLYFSVAIGRAEQLYSARREVIGGDFGGAVELENVNSGALDGSPFPSSDEQRLYFFSERAGVGARDVWFAERAQDGSAFAEPSLVAGVNAAGDDFLPWLSADERVLMFASERDGTRGGTDIWRAERASVADDFGAISNVGELNTDNNEGRVALSRDGRRVFFTSDREGGQGEHDIWTAARPSVGDPFGPAVNVAELNGGGSEIDVFLAGDDREIFFASTREGASALWRSVRSCAGAEP